MKNLNLNTVVKFVFFVVVIIVEACLIVGEMKSNDKTVTTTNKTETNATQTTESAVLQDITISDGCYYYKGEQISLESEATVVLDMLINSPIDTVIPVATYVQSFADGTKVMYLD